MVEDFSFHPCEFVIGVRFSGIPSNKKWNTSISHPSLKELGTGNKYNKFEQKPWKYEQEGNTVGLAVEASFHHSLSSQEASSQSTMPKYLQQKNHQSHNMNWESTLP